MSEVNVQIQNPQTAVNIQNPQITIEIPTESIEIELQEGQPIEIQVQNPVIEVNIGGPCNCDGGGAWGEITGTLSDQTDLQTALDGKSDTGHTHPLSELEQSGATTGQVPKWNGSEWAPADDETGGGGASIQSDTYANWETARAAGELTPGATIIVTDRADLGLILQCADVDAFGVAGVGGFLNADFQAVGDYSGVEGETGIAAGTQQGIWQAAGEGGYTQGDVVIWNLTHYQLTDSGAVDGTDPATNTAAYTALARTVANVGYIEEWDAVEFDWAGDAFTYRQDLRGGVVRGATGIAGYQWGRTGCSGNNIQSPATFDIRNLVGTFSNNTTLPGATVSGIVTGADTVIENNIIENGGALSDLTAGANCAITRNKIGAGAVLGDGTTIGDNCSIEKNTLFANAELIGITAGASCNIVDNILENSGSITDITAGANCSISRNKVGQEAIFGGSTTMGEGAYISNNTLGPAAIMSGNILGAGAFMDGNGLENGARIEENSLADTTSISYNLLEQYSAIGYNTVDDLSYIDSNILYGEISNKITNGNVIVNNYLTGFTWTNAESLPGSFESNFFGYGRSSISATADATGVTAIDLAAYSNAGTINITSTNATESIDTITNPPTAFPFILRPAAGLTLTITGTAYSGIAAGQIALKATDYTLDGDKGEYIVLEIDPLGTGALIEKQVVNGLI